MAVRGDFAGGSVYAHFYLAQAVRYLGDTGYAKLLPNSKQDERLTWRAYRNVVFGAVVDQQAADGSWNDSTIGPVFATSLCLIILQQDTQPTFGPR